MKSINRLFSMFPNLPDIAGEGAIFAYSGMDGVTQSQSNFVLTIHDRPYDFLIHTEYRHQLRIRPVQEGGTVRIAVGDVFAVEFDPEFLLMSFAFWHTLVGILPENCKMDLFREDNHSSGHLSRCSANGAYLALSTGNGRFSLSIGGNEEEAVKRAENGLLLDPLEVAADRLESYRSLPVLPDPGRDRFLRKCFSIMKVNTLHAEGIFTQSWSTPDRVPHRDMWLWDSVFHSFGMNHVNPDLSWDFLKSVLDQQNDDGMIPHQARVNGWKSGITQPPILAWGVWQNYLIRNDRSALAYAAERISGYLDWDCHNRDQNGNDLLEWYIEENENCRSGESGMDNSQRFDEALLLDAVDFSTFAALDMGYLSKIYNELGNEELADQWKMRSQTISTAVHRDLWNADIHFYCDRKMAGEFSPVEANAGFLPLLLDDFPLERLSFLLNALQDPARFNTVFPIPTVSLESPGWGTDMWRGATWINLNYLIALGFEKQGASETGKIIRRRSLEMVQKYYEQLGVIFEFYDAKDRLTPPECDRKGPRKVPYDFRRKMDSIRDYHWSAALCFHMLAEDLF